MQAVCAVPTHVGVTRCFVISRMDACCSPHACGGDPGEVTTLKLPANAVPTHVGVTPIDVRKHLPKQVMSPRFVQPQDLDLTTH